MKKFITITVIMALIAIFAVTIVACEGDNASNTPLEPVGDTAGATLWQVAERIGKSKNINFAEAMNLSLGGLLEINNGSINKRLKYDLKVNINTLDGIGDAYNNNFYIRINNADNDEVVMGVFADGHDVYLDLGEVGYKYENVSLNGGKTDGGNARLSIDAESVVTLIGELLFNEVKANEDIYEFNFNVGTVSEKILPLVFVLANANIDSFAEELGFADFNDMAAYLKAYSGSLIFDFNADTFNGIKFDFNGNGDKFNLSLDSIDLQGTNVAIDFESLIPKRNYIVTKAINFKSNGEFYLDSVDGSIAKYTWELVADIDPFNNRGMTENDDIFHLVVKNVTADNKDEFNQSKIKATDGVILELAYAPKLFNTDNLLAAVNLKSILSSNILISAGVPSSFGKLLPDYFGTHIDLDCLTMIGNQGSVQTKSGNGSKSIFDIFKMIKIDNGSIEINRELITAILGDDPALNSLLDTETLQTETLKLNVNFMSYGSDNKDYALAEHFLYAANDNGGTKNFGLGLKPSKSSMPVTDDGFMLATDIYGNQFNGRTDKISLEELELLIGGNMNYIFTDYWNAERKGNSAVKILGISGIDKELFGVEQTVNVLTAMPDGNNLMGLLNSFNVNIDLPTNVYKTKIILTKAEKIEFIPNYNETIYRIGDAVTLENKDCNMSVLYSDGEQKIYSSSAISHNLPIKTYNELPTLFALGNYTVNYFFGNKIYERNITVAEPDSVVFDIKDNIGYNLQAIPQNFGTAKVTYGDVKLNMPINFDMVTFPKGAVEGGKFTTYGDYFIRINAYGKDEVKRVRVAPQINRYSLSLSGNNENAVLKLVTSQVNDIAPKNVKLIVTQEKKTLISWVNNGNVIADADGVNVAYYSFDLPYIGDKTVNIKFNDIDAANNIRIRVKAVDDASGIIIGEGLLEFNI